jgi:CubicO group peptidase (beta-lactamase class C family)
MVGSERLLPADWVTTAHTETGRDGLGRIHTMHWWMLGDNPWGAYFASGYRGQYVLVVPPLRLVIARLGETPTEQRHHVSAALTELIADYERRRSDAQPALSAKRRGRLGRRDAADA